MAIAVLGLLCIGKLGMEQLGMEQLGIEKLGIEQLNIGTATDFDPPLCPDEESIKSSGDSIEGKEIPDDDDDDDEDIPVEIINEAGITIALYWVNFGGYEEPVCLRSVVVCC